MKNALAQRKDIPGDQELRDLKSLREKLNSFSTPQTLELHLASGYLLGMIERILYPLKGRHDLKQALRAVHKALKPHIYRCRLVHGEQIARVHIVAKGRGVVDQNRTRILDEPIHGKRDQSASGIAPRVGEGREGRMAASSDHTGLAPPGNALAASATCKAKLPNERPQKEPPPSHLLPARQRLFWDINP